MKNPSLQTKADQGGFATMDVVIAVILVAALAGGVFYFANKGNASRLAADEAAQFNVMAQDAVSKYAGQGNYEGATATVLINHGVVPPSMINGNTITSGFNTVVTIAPANLGGSTNDGLAFTYNVPRKVCSNFVNGVSAAKITVGGSTVLDETNGINKMDVTALGTACNASAGSGNVTVILTKGR